MKALPSKGRNTTPQIKVWPQIKEWEGNKTVLIGRLEQVTVKLTF